jgi:hypothetical protein
MSKYLKGFAGEQVSARLTRETEKKDFLYYILRAKNPDGTPAELSPTDLGSEAVALIIGSKFLKSVRSVWSTYKCVSVCI